MEEVNKNMSERVALMPLRPAKRTRTCTWPRRKKASACTVSNFPWEIVISHLKRHPRSLILMQMVDKNLNSVLKKSDLLWLDIYKRMIYRTAYCHIKVNDPRYPGLSLHKSDLNGLTIHTGALRGDVDFNPSFAFEESFTSYVRRAFALKFGTRCGMCGCRHHHEIYWSLGMRVCRMCVAHNMVSSVSLFFDYGVYFSELINDYPGQIFYCQITPSLKELRIAYHQMKPSELTPRASRYMLWKPHVERLVDLPAKYREQKEKLAAVALISSVVKRTFITSLRLKIGSKSRPSAYNMIVGLYHNEKMRVFSNLNNEYSSWTIGGSTWAFHGYSISRKHRCEVMHRPDIPCNTHTQNVYRGADKVPRLH